MKHRAVEILEDLIRIQSVNPHYKEGAKGEKEISDYIERRCLKHCLSVKRQQVFPGRDNLLIELKAGEPTDAALLFEAHMDTVSLGSMENPLVPAYRDGRLYGRGACDTKGSLAGMLYAMEECAKAPETLQSNLMLCASVDEEHAYRGLMAFLDLDLPVSGAVVGEPTEMRIVIAHKGCVRFSVTTHGKAAHSSVPHEGINAVYQMMEIIDYLRREIEPRISQKRHPLCGSPTLVVGIIQGGKQINIVPENCVIEVDRRIIPGEDPFEVFRQIQGELYGFAESRGIALSIQELLRDWALDTPEESVIVDCACTTASELRLNAGVCGVTYGSDASKLQQLRGIPAIVYGPGSIQQAHTKEEWVPVREVEQAAEFYLRVAKSYKH